MISYVRSGLMLVRAIFVCATVVGLLVLDRQWSAAARVDNAPKNEQDQFEERAIARAAERELRVAQSDRVRWLRELKNEFPRQIGAGETEDEFAAWFVLLAGKENAWRRENAPNKQFAELFDRVVQKLDLGPVPSVRKEEFLLYAKKALRMEKNQNQSDPNADADKAFRVLDRDADGVLGQGEWTSGLRAVAGRVDVDKNGRIDRDEYRAYFSSRVTSVVDNAIVAKSAPKSDKAAPAAMNAKGGRAQPALPAWFQELDFDGDGQVALHEWRKAGLPAAAFMDLDLNDDGLLTPEEYHRFVKKYGEQSVKVDLSNRTASVERDDEP